MIDKSGNIYVGDAYNQRIQQFDSNGLYLSQFPSPTGDTIGLALDGLGNFYSATLNEVYKFDENGSILKIWKCEGEACYPDPGCPFIHDIVIDSNNNLYVLDVGACNIQKYTSEGVFVKKWGQRGSDVSEFNIGPSGEASLLAIDAFDNLYVGDDGNCRVQVFNTDGDFIKQWGSCDWQDFYVFGGLYADNDGHLFISNKAKNCIQKFTVDGQL